MLKQNVKGLKKTQDMGFEDLTAVMINVQGSGAPVTRFFLEPLVLMCIIP
jgi:hypothetical protein